MRLLLDTHAFLWWVDGERPLPARARAAIADASNECFVSTASVWEMAIKSGLGMLKLAAPVGRFVAEHVAANRFRMLEIGLAHAARVEAMPAHHGDPFDRLLVAQALEDDLVVVSADPVFRRYGVRRIW